MHLVIKTGLKRKQRGLCADALYFSIARRQSAIAQEKRWKIHFCQHFSLSLSARFDKRRREGINCEHLSRLRCDKAPGINRLSLKTNNILMFFVEKYHTDKKIKSFRIIQFTGKAKLVVHLQPQSNYNKKEVFLTFVWDETKAKIKSLSFCASRHTLNLFGRKKQTEKSARELKRSLLKIIRYLSSFPMRRIISFSPTGDRRRSWRRFPKPFTRCEELILGSL